MQICNYIIPKSLKLKTSIKFQKAYSTMKEYQKKLLVIAKNNIKKRIHIGTLKVRDICNNLKLRTSKEDFLLMQRTNEK